MPDALAGSKGDLRAGTDARVTAPAMTESGFRVQVLGPFAFHQDGVPVDTAAWPRQASSLLRLLAVSPRFRRSRDELIDVLWPEATPEAGSSNLRRVVHLLRRALGNPDPSPILSERGQVSFNQDYKWEIDLARFEMLLGKAGDNLDALREAVTLYRGESLPEDRYEEWAAPVREHARRRWRDACLRLASEQPHSAGPESAVIWLERLLESDPLDEEVVQELLTALGEAGRRTEALRLYREFEQRLETELAVDPAPETQAIVARLRELPGRPTSTHVARKPEPRLSITPTYPLPIAHSLVGREPELQRILALLPNTEPSVKERGRAVMVAGEAGMGKTRLLAEAAQQAREGGALVLAGGSYQQEGRLPYGPIHDALLDYVRAQPKEVIELQLDGLLPDLCRVVPELRSIVDVPPNPGGEDQGQRLRLFSAVALGLARITEQAPLLIVLDDLHWADDATLQMLHFLLRQSHLDRVFFLAAYRQEELTPGSSLAQLISSVKQNDLQVAILSLQPLASPDISALLQDALGTRCSQTLVETLCDRGHGNPFVVQQLLSLLRQQERLEGGADGLQITAGTMVVLPPAVQETVAQRLRHLTPEQRETLLLGSVLGREFSHLALEALWQGQEETLFASLDAVTEARLIVETEIGYSFTHPLLREVVYGQIPKPRRPRLHGRAGLALETIHVRHPEEHAAELAYHFELSGQLHGDRALRYLGMAGDSAAAALAWDEAVRYYSRALTFAEDDDAQAAQLQLRLGRVLGRASHYDEALEVLERAATSFVQLGDGANEGQAVAVMGRAHVDRGTAREGIARVQPVVDSLESAPPHVDTLQALMRLNGILFYLFAMSHPHELSLPAAERERSLAQAIGDDHALVWAEMHRGMALMIVGRYPEARQILEEVAPLVERVGDPCTVSYYSLCLGVHYLESGEVEKSRPFAERVLENARRSSGPDVVAFYMANVCEIHIVLGEWETAHRLGLQALDLVRPFSTSWYTPYPYMHMGSLSLAEGAWQEASDYWNTGLAMAEAHNDMQAVHGTTLGLAELELLRNDPASALTRLESLLERLGPAGSDEPVVLAMTGWAHLETGDAARAEDRVVRAIDLARSHHQVLQLPGVLRIYGMVLSRQRRWKQAEQAFEEAVRLAHTMPYPYAEARARYEWGHMLTCQSLECEAREQLNEALAIFRQLGAQMLAKRTEQALASL